MVKECTLNRLLIPITVVGLVVRWALEVLVKFLVAVMMMNMMTVLINKPRRWRLSQGP